jgi:hypothetical protein
MEPLMKVLAERHILWEITASPIECGFIPQRADELGVRFTATADAHFLNSEWGPLSRHNAAENNIDSLGLTKGLVSV